jgi:hypothetical protein
LKFINELLIQDTQRVFWAGDSFVIKLGPNVIDHLPELSYKFMIVEEGQAPSRRIT